MSHFLNARAAGYQDLPDFPLEAPDPSVRVVEPPPSSAPVETKLFDLNFDKPVKKKKGDKNRSFYSESDDESEKSESESDTGSDSESENGTDSNSGTEDSESDSGESESETEESGSDSSEDNDIGNKLRKQHPSNGTEDDKNIKQRKVVHYGEADKKDGVINSESDSDGSHNSNSSSEHPSKDELNKTKPESKGDNGDSTHIENGSIQTPTAVISTTPIVEEQNGKV